ncbi:uncharacterized protein PG986_000090 [Apiospora aurea]|uniref:Ankyrin repeat protein n=1 Tax=Apiospora aurea TaxID=335848 RepID=A0ABR1QT39_9PEZI
MAKVLVLAGSLKPEVKLGVALSEFSQVLDPKYRRRFEALRGGSPGLLNPAEVIQLTEELNQKGARSHRTWRPYSTRICSFLHRIQVFASIGDVCIGGAQNLIASGSTIGFLTYFDKLSTILMNMTSSWALHRDFAALFPQSRDLQAYTSSYVIAVVQLCKKVVMFSGQPTLKQFTSSLTNSFEREFGPYISELDQWGKLIEQHCYMLATEHQIHAEQSAVERAKALVHSVSSASREQKRFLLKQAVLRSLLPDQNHFETRWRRQRRKGTCPWLLNHPKYREWKQESAPEDRLWDRVVSTEDAGLMSVSDMEDLILVASRVEDRIFVVIDAPEESDPEEIDDTFHFLAGLARKRTVLLCCSSRPESACQTRFHRIIDSMERISISLDNEARSEEIEQFIASEIERKAAGKDLDPELKSFMKAQLVGGAQGMYLWVSLQLEALLPERSGSTANLGDILELLCHLPASLPEAFDQALSRIRDRRYGSDLFKLVTAAERPLTVDEFRVALAVVPGDTKWDETKLPTNPKAVVYGCGGNLLEVDEEHQTVHFIHHSAMVHLVSDSSRDDTRALHFELQEAESHIGAVCVTLLHYEIFDQRVSRKPRTVSGVTTTQNIINSSSGNSPIWARVARHIGSHSKGKPLADIDIGAVLYGMTKSAPNSTTVTFLLRYASIYWLKHTSMLTPNMSTIWRLWTSILQGELGHVELPWSSTAMGDILDWASKQKHHALTLYALRSDLLEWGDILSIDQLAWRGQWQLQFEPALLSDILARTIHEFQDSIVEAPCCSSSMSMLVDLLPQNYQSTITLAGAEERAADFHHVLCDFLDHSTVSRSLHRPLSCRLVEDALWKGFLDAGLLMVEKFGVATPEHQQPNSSLAIAVDAGASSLVQGLLSCGHSPTASSIQGTTALELALELQQFDIFVRLLDWVKKNEPDTFRWMRQNETSALIHRAVVSGQPIMVEHLLKQGFTPFLERVSIEVCTDNNAQTYETPFVAAIRLNRMSELQLLIALLDPGFNDNPPALHPPPAPCSGGSSQGDRQLVEKFIEADGSALVLDHGKQTPLALISCRHLSYLRRKLENETEIPQAILSASLERITSPSELDIWDCYGSSLLHYAVTCRIDAVVGILRLGADPNIRTTSGLTPLLQAIVAYSVSPSDELLQGVIIPLLEHGARPSVSGLHDVSVMEKAVRYQATEAWKSFLRCVDGPDGFVEHSVRTTTNPLARGTVHYVDIHVETGNSTVIELLLKDGARDERPSMVGEEGQVQQQSY